MELDDGPPGLVRDQSGPSQKNNGSAQNAARGQPSHDTPAKAVSTKPLSPQGRRISLVAVVHSIAAFANKVGTAFAPEDGESHLIGSDESVSDSKQDGIRRGLRSTSSKGANGMRRGMNRRHSDDSIAAMERGKTSEQRRNRQGYELDAGKVQDKHDSGRSRITRASMPASTAARSARSTARVPFAEGQAGQRTESGDSSGVTSSEPIRQAWAGPGPAGSTSASIDPVQRMMEGLQAAGGDSAALQSGAPAGGQGHREASPSGLVAPSPGRSTQSDVAERSYLGRAGAGSGAGTGAGAGRAGGSTASSSRERSADGGATTDPSRATPLGYGAQRGRRGSSQGRRHRSSAASLKGGTEVRPARLASSTMSYDPGDDCCGDACQCFLWGEDYGETYH